MNEQEFDARLRSGTLRLAFVGMSNVGKTSRSRALKSALAFEHIDIDGEICTELGLEDMHALAAWLGYPGSEGYRERERRYLDLEEARTTLTRDMHSNAVLDTTGSVVHLSDEAQDAFKRDFFVVHFSVGEEMVHDLSERFFAVPKPVVWSEYFSQAEGESTQEALVRCYPDLLRARLDKFKKLAHVNIPMIQVDLDDGRAILRDIRSHL